MPSVLSAMPDLSQDLGSPFLLSTVSSPGGLSSCSFSHSGKQMFLEVSESEDSFSDSEASHVLSEVADCAMEASDIPDTMVDSAISLDALSFFLHTNKDSINLSQTEVTRERVV